MTPNDGAKQMVELKKALLNFPEAVDHKGSVCNETLYTETDISDFIKTTFRQFAGQGDTAAGQGGEDRKRLEETLEFMNTNDATWILEKFSAQQQRIELLEARIAQLTEKK